MSQGSEAAEQMTRDALQISEAAVTLAALGAKNLAALCLALANDNQKLAGRTNMTRLLKSGKELRVFDLKESDLQKFRAAAKQYGVLFSVIKNSRDTNGHVDVLSRAEDVAKINRIFDKLNYAVPEPEQGQEDRVAKKADPRVRPESRSAERGTGLTPEETLDQSDPRSAFAEIWQSQLSAKSALPREAALEEAAPRSVFAKIRQIKIRQEKLPAEPVLPGKDKSR